MTAQNTQYNIFQQLTSARLVDTSNLSGTYINGPLNNGVGATLSANTVGVLTIDSVVANLNDRILLVGQSNGNENGVYIVTQAGGASAIWVLTRAADQQCIEQMKAGQFIPINAGTANAGAMYVMVEPLPAALGIDDVNFSPTSVPSGSTFLVASNNLSDLTDPTQALINLGIGSVPTSYLSVAITAAQFNGMYTTPKLLLAAQGANTLIVVDKAYLELTFNSAQYASGGVVALQYDSTVHGAGVAATDTVAAASFTGAADSTSYLLEGALSAALFNTTVNKGLYLSNQTAAFTTGDSDMVLHLFYRVIPTA